jgi:hypothetical protein
MTALPETQNVMRMTRDRVLDLYFMEARAKLIDLAAFLDRRGPRQGRTIFASTLFGRPSRNCTAASRNAPNGPALSERSESRSPLPAATTKAASGAWPEPNEPCATSNLMPTWSAERRMIIWPWPPRAARRFANRRFGPDSIVRSVDGFYDYFRQLTEYEPKRAAKYGLAALLLALPQSKGSGGPHPGRRSAGDHSAIPGPPQCPGHRRNWVEQKQPERTDGIREAR